MRRSTSQKRHPRFDSLEEKTLLSGLQLHPVVHPAVAVAATGTGQVSPSATTTPLVPIGNALPDTVVQNLQTVSSGGNAELFMSQVEALLTSNANVRQYAQEVVADHQMSDVQETNLAQMKGLILPSGISTADLPIAQQFVAAIHTTNFDQTYLKLMAQVNQRDLGLERQLATSSDAQVAQVAQSSVAEDQLHLQQAQTLQVNSGTALTNLTPTSTPTTTPPSGTSLGAADIAYLQSNISDDNLELVISTLAPLVDTNADVQNYAMKLASDHRMALTQAQSLANSYNLALLPGISDPTNQQAARQVLSSLNTSTFNAQSFEQTYLRTNVQVHQADLTADNGEAASTRNPNMKQFAQEDIPTVNLHLLGAQALLNGVGTNGPTGGTTGGSGGGLTLGDLNPVNVRERLKVGPGLSFTLTFDAGGYTYSQRYSIVVRRTGRGGSVGRIAPSDATQAFLSELRSQLAAAGYGTTSGTAGGIATGGGFGGTNSAGSLTNSAVQKAISAAQQKVSGVTVQKTGATVKHRS